MRIPKFAAVLLVLSALACGPAAEARHPGVGPEVRALHVPFDDYKLSRLDLYTIEYAEDLLTRRCMRALGMDWQLLPAPPARDPDPLNRRRYGLLEMGSAQTYGYHLPPPAPEVAAREQVWATRKRLPAAELAAAYGDDGQGGCRGEARRRLRSGTTDPDQERLRQLSASAFAEALGHPTALGLFREWSDCVQEAGFAYPDPFTAHADDRWSTSGSPSPLEVDVATADVRCKHLVELVPRMAALEKKIQDGIIATMRDEFARFRRDKDAELTAAEQVIRDS